MSSLTLYGQPAVYVWECATGLAEYMSHIIKVITLLVELYTLAIASRTVIFYNVRMGTYVTIMLFIHTVGFTGTHVPCHDILK